MNELWTSIISGGFAGAGVVALLSKLLLESRLKQAVQKFQHELDIKKEVLQTDLSLYAHEYTLKYSKHDESQRLALENIYKAVISTSFSRAGFKKFKSLGAITDNEKFCTEYFKAFDISFQAFSSAFQKVSNAFDALADNSIYVNEEMEQTVNLALQQINQYYSSVFGKLNSSHSIAQNMFIEKTLNKGSLPIEFESFYNEALSHWLAVTNSSTSALKHAVRQLLKPETRA
jgi:antitoxin component of RelBE/YafQ-DinJ toxin-antitoxin module